MSLTLPDLATVVAAVRQSVVAVNTEVSGYGIFGAYTDEGAGSGWIIDPAGYIVTNNHVVEGATSVTVTLENGQTYAATSIYTDSFSDLAVIKIDAAGLPAGLKPGQWVVAIGNSLGLGISATSGIVSALGVSISVSANEAMYDLIQTDAAINPGNSGGPLVNLKGEVIGISCAKVSEVGVEGMGYAISIGEALPVLTELISTGFITRPDLGATLYSIDDSIARRYRLAVTQGALVTQVVKGGPADNAGIKAGDVITAIAGSAVASAPGCMLTLQKCGAGSQVEVVTYRGSAERKVTVNLGQTR
jgi:serine protease Do